MKVNLRASTSLAALLAVLTVCAPQPAAAAPGAKTPQPRLAGHVPVAAIARAHLLGRVAPAQTVGLALTLPLRNQGELSALLSRLYTPGDPLSGKFLTPAEFTARFGPTESDYAAVMAAAKQSGLQVTGTHPNRLILDVSGPASAVEAAFGLTLSRYRKADGREFYAPNAGPLLPRGLAGRLAGVVGLDTAVRLRPHLRPAVVAPSVLSGRAGSGPGGGLSPSDIKTAYSLQTTADGTGQTVALFELDGYTPSDIRAYEAQFGLPQVTLQNILVGSATGAAGTLTDEVTLDIELAQALAPNIGRILVYEAPNSESAVLDCYSRIANDNLAKQISTSFGEPESVAVTNLTAAENRIFQQMAAQGQSVFAASGDLGAYDDGTTLSLDDPGSQPYVTSLGGTSLATNGTGGPYAGETAWGVPYSVSDPASGTGGYGIGGGGGFSTLWPTPSYQTALPLASAGRSVPDVALDSDPQTGYAVYTGGKWAVFGGTSAAAPLWAGFNALVNQGRAAAGKAPVGFLNPLLYAIGGSAAYSADFHDITSGTNLFYPAGTGYDNASGLGSFRGDALLSTLVSGQVAPQTANISGTITAADTGAALTGVAVSALSSPGGVSVGTAATDTSGAYTLPVPAGVSLSVIVSAYAATAGRYAGAKLPAAALAAGGTATLSAALRPAHTFPAGLQMISSPDSYSAALGDFNTLFAVTPTAAGRIARLVAWNPAAGSYALYPAAPANTLTPGAGYWVNFPAPAYPHFDGVPTPTTVPFSLPLSVGWNLIGDPFPAAVLLPPSAQVSPTLYRYDTPSAQYVAINSAAAALQPYAGYWIYAYQPVTLSIPAP